MNERDVENQEKREEYKRNYNEMVMKYGNKRLVALIDYSNCSVDPLGRLLKRSRDHLSLRNTSTFTVNIACLVIVGMDGFLSLSSGLTFHYSFLVYLFFTFPQHYLFSI